MASTPLQYSGIYKIEFSDGSCYVGKSNNIDRRFNEHIRKFVGGTASAKMQAKFDSLGPGVGTILCECHPDHIDLMETYYIRLLRPNLNSAATVAVSNKDIETLEGCSEEILQQSTGEHIARVESLARENNELKFKLMEAKQGNGMEMLENTNNLLRFEVLKLRKRKLWDRIFNT